MTEHKNSNRHPGAAVLDIGSRSAHHVIVSTLGKIVPAICLSLLLLGAANVSNLGDLAARLVYILESRMPIGIAADDDLTPLVCPLIEEVPLLSIYEELQFDPLASFLQEEGYDILSIERHSNLVTIELRILRDHTDSECAALLFNKHP